MTDADDKRRTPYAVASVDAGISLLEAIADQPGQGVTALARRVVGSKSRAFRLFHTLEQRGYVIKDDVAHGYCLGYRALYLGDRASRPTNLIFLAQPFLEELAMRSLENVHLIAREGLRSVCVALYESPQNLRIYAQVGRRGPLHTGGGSKVLLAYAEDEVRAAALAVPLERYTDATITDPAQLVVVLDGILHDGYHVALGDVDENAFAVSAPIRDHREHVVAALSFAGPTYWLSDETLERHRADVLEIAQRISAALR